jgi:hypothetical protein
MYIYVLIYIYIQHIGSTAPTRGREAAPVGPRSGLHGGVDNTWDQQEEEEEALHVAEELDLLGLDMREDVSPPKQYGSSSSNSHQASQQQTVDAFGDPFGSNGDYNNNTQASQDPFGEDLFMIKTQN